MGVYTSVPAVVTNVTAGLEQGPLRGSENKVAPVRQSEQRGQLYPGALLGVRQ